MKPSEEFEESGVWWLPENHEDKVSGRIKYSKDDWFILTLTGTKDAWISKNEDNNFQLIYGQTVGGTYYSLYDCYSYNSKWSGTKLYEIKIHVNTVFKGFLIPSPELKNIRSIECGFTFLKMWTSVSGFKVKNRKRANFDISYRHPQDLLLLKNKNFTIKLLHFPTTIPLHPPMDGKIDINEIAHIIIKSQKPVSFNDYKHILRTLQDFFTIIFQRLSIPENIYAYGNFNYQVLNNGKRYYPTAEVFYYLNFIDKEKFTPHPLDFILRYEDVIDEINMVLENWITKSKKLETSRILYISSLYHEFTLEVKFLLLCQSFESYHRQFFEDTYTTKDEFCKIADTLVQSIPNNLESNFKDSLKKRITYLNEYSLSKRLKTVINNHRVVFNTHLKKINIIIQDIVDYRNFLTHGRVEGNIDKIDYKKLFYLQNVMRFVLEFCFFKEMGFNDRKIIQLIKNNRIYKYRFNI